MKTSYIPLLIIVLFYFSVSAQQQHEKDSHLDSLYQSCLNYLHTYDYKNGIETTIRLIEQSKAKDNNFYQYHAHNILGASYYDLHDTIRSQRNYEDALTFANILNNDTLRLWSYNNLGNIFSENKKTTQKGIDFYNLAYSLATKLEIEDQKLLPTINIAWTYIDNKDYKQAGPYLTRSWKLIEKGKNSRVESQLDYISGKYYLGINNLDKAREYYEQGINLIEKDSLILEGSVFYQDYAHLLFLQEDYQQAYLAEKKFTEYNSQIFEKEKLHEIEAANAKFDVSQYQQDLEIAKKEQVFKDEVIEKSQEKMIIMVISSIFLLIVLIALYKISRSRRRLISEMSIKNDELTKAKEEAERLSILKTKFFSTISHELRTPLYGVIGLTSILLEDKELHKHETDLKSLKFSADYLLALINDVLQINKMESNLLKLESIPFNLEDLLRSIVKSFEFTRLQNKNDIHLQIDPSITRSLMGDTVRLSQILMNLVGNAMKFTERGDIWIKAELKSPSSTKQKIYFEITDNGIGIPENKQQVIFEEFSQLKSANYNYQGTGLGLPIVRKLLNLFNSEIHLESKEGKGSTFHFTIEFDVNHILDAPKSMITAEEAMELENVGTKYILIVDDNRINQVVTQRILEKKQFVCDICDNGEDAIESVRNKHFDLVLMDVNMPGISGLEATVEIRKFNSNIPIVALTAVEIEEIRDEIYKAGMNDIIVKPYDTSRFYQVIFRNIPVEMISR